MAALQFHDNMVLQCNKKYGFPYDHAHARAERSATRAAPHAGAAFVVCSAAQQPPWRPCVVA
jgi:hypothetical protein